MNPASRMPSRPRRPSGRRCTLSVMNAPARTDGRLTVALVSEVFWQPAGAVRLAQRLAGGAERGADTAARPEIARNPGSPSTKVARADDAEPLDGPRHRIMARAAVEAGIGLIGGIIHADPQTGRRTN